MKSAIAQLGPARRTVALAAWLLGVLLCCVVVGRTTFTTDLSAFLPQTPSKEQKVLLDQLRDGVVSHLILVGIEGGASPAVRAALSKQMAKVLRKDAAFVTVNNGEPINAERDRAFLFGNRYLLSPAVTAARFSAVGLHDAIGDTIDLLASPAGMLIKPLLPRDPTGEIVQLLDQFNGGAQPRMTEGAWASKDDARAIVLAQTAADSTDIDAHQHAMQQIDGAFEAARAQQGTAAAGARLVMTGPGVFAVKSRATIKDEVTRLSIISTAIIIGLLLLVYRSLLAVALGLLPVVSGALVGVVAVSLGFGLVHGITLGFGTTLIGESVDYSIYLFVQSRAASSADAVDDGSAAQDWIVRFWPTIRLGVLASIVGFASLLMSSFPGLAQLGWYSITGLVAAALVTRFVLPHLLPENFRIRDVSAIGNRIAGIARHASALHWPAVLLIAACALVLVAHRSSLWNMELGALSPVSMADQAADARLRADIGAPDARYMVAISGTDREALLQSVEIVGRHLQGLVERGVLAGFDSPARFLPSVATQRARQASLPALDLSRRIDQAVAGLPLRTQLFGPFVADVAAAKNHAPLQRKDLDGTSFALALDALLFQRGTQWNAMLPLTVADGGAVGLAVAPVRAALAAANQPNVLFVDLKAESDHLYSAYVHEAGMLSLAGLAGIVVLLALALRSFGRVLRVMLPLVAAVVTVTAMLALGGQRLTILHLVGLLLIVAVGSNYALFFNQRKDSLDGVDIAPQTLTSLVFANLTTVAGFGILGFSQLPILQAIGVTVGPGAVLALAFSAIFADRQAAAGAPAVPTQ